MPAVVFDKPPRVLIVDDEPLARRGVRARLAREEDFDVVGEAASGREAVRVIAEIAPDLVFLDVQMPGLDGFGVVEAVGPDRMPVTVFLTAYDQHALRAFDADALDYLLKPIDDERFAQALSRARRRIEERRESALGRKLAAVLGEVGPVEAVAPEKPPEARNARTVERFLIKSGGPPITSGSTWARRPISSARRWERLRCNWIRSASRESTARPSSTWSGSANSSRTSTASTS
jgi:CheY-like chemotaxis protein